MKPTLVPVVILLFWLVVMAYLFVSRSIMPEKFLGPIIVGWIIVLAVYIGVMTGRYHGRF